MTTETKSSGQTYQYDEKKKEYHPYPQELEEMIRRDVFNKGEFSSVYYQADEMPDPSNGFTITDGSKLRKKVRSKLKGLDVDFMVRRWSASENPFTQNQLVSYLT